MLQRFIVMRRFYISYKQVKTTYSVSRAYAVFCGRCIIAVNLDYLYVQKQGKLASVCLQRCSSTVLPANSDSDFMFCLQSY